MLQHVAPAPYEWPVIIVMDDGTEIDVQALVADAKNQRVVIKAGANGTKKRAATH